MEADAQGRRWTLVAVCVTTFMLLLDITIVNVALPSIQRRLHAGLTGLEWVVDAYALTLAALILTAGALADRYGRRLLFIAGVLVFTSASLLCGLAWNIVALDVARAIQGVGGAALFATALALIGHEYRGPERGGAIAIWGATIGAAVASGPLVGGILTDSLGWRWVFFVNVPVGAFALFVALTRMNESRDERAVRADVWGLLTWSAALFLIVFGLLRGNSSGWNSALILGSLVGGGLLLVAFVVVERMQERPMLDIDLFGRPEPLTVFVIAVPLATRRFAPTASSHWTALLAGLIVAGIGIGLAKPRDRGRRAAHRRPGPHRDGLRDQQRLQAERRCRRSRGPRRRPRAPRRELTRVDARPVRSQARPGCERGRPPRRRRGARRSATPQGSRS